MEISPRLSEPCFTCQVTFLIFTTPPLEGHRWRSLLSVLVLLKVKEWQSLYASAPYYLTILRYWIYAAFSRSCQSHRFFSPLFVFHLIMTTLTFSFSTGNGRVILAPGRWQLVVLCHD